MTPVKSTDRFEATDDEKAANEAVNAFSYKFALNSLSDASSEGEKNLAVSPLGVTMALGLYANSTDENAEQTVCNAFGVESLEVFNSLNTKLMGYLGNPKLGGAVELANSVWYTESMSPLAKYVNEMNEVYFADINAADLSSKEGLKVVDTWVNSKTHEMIPSISDMINPSEDLASILINALYFAGEWEEQFDAAKTTKETFKAVGGDQTCDMMHNSIQAYYSSEEIYDMVEFHFKGTSEISLVLPKEGVSLSEVRQAMLAAADVKPLNGKERVELNLGLPKFKVESMMNLNSTLGRMGCNLSAAKLKKMGLEAMLCGEIAQKDIIAIDEEGAKLVAVTFTTLTSNGNETDPKVVDMTFDRPFMFFIHNYTTKSIIMAGQVVEP